METSGLSPRELPRTVFGTDQAADLLNLVDQSPHWGWVHPSAMRCIYVMCECTGRGLLAGKRGIHHLPMLCTSLVQGCAGKTKS